MAHILVIDDDADIRETLSKAFSSQRHTVTTATDGEEGLKVIDERVPDLIFLDLSMLGGIGVLDALQQNPRLQVIPIIILTAQAEHTHLVECLEKGANDYIIKPLGMHELFARANVQLRIQDLERQIRASETYHRALFERSADPQMVVMINGQIRQINDAAKDLLAFTNTSLIDQQIHHLVDPQDQREFAIAFN